MDNIVPRISVVIPLYNKKPHIDRALNSVLAQTNPPQEIVVIDDGSTDGGGEIVKTFTDPRIRLIRQENCGCGVARNRGVQLATGELIAFLDADDAWKPGYLTSILNLRNKFPQAGAYATAYDVVDRDGSMKNREFKVLSHDQQFGLIENFFLAGFCYPVLASALTVPKSIVEEVEGFSACHIGQDIDFVLKVALRYPIAWTREPLVTYYRNVVNPIAGLTRWKGIPAISRTTQNAINAGLVPPNLVKDLMEYVNLFQLPAMRDCLVLGKKDKALMLLEHSRGTEIFKREWWIWRIIAALPGNVGPWLWKVKQLFKFYGSFYNV
jgi:glycosyltransferase involved in cell wall biosynthesis